MSTTKRQVKKSSVASKKKKTSAAGSKRAARKSSPGKVGPVNEWVALRRSTIQGLGAFALKDIPKGTRIIEYTGEKISNAEADRRYDDAKMRRHHTFLFILNSRTVIDAARDGNAARFINHSCSPNCEAVIERGRIWVDTTKKIPAGTEILYDYAYENDAAYTEEDLRFYACHCGSDNCRGTIVKTRRKVRS